MFEEARYTYRRDVFSASRGWRRQDDDHYPALDLEDAPACDDIILASPGFFADPTGIQNAAADVREHEGWVSEDVGAVTGFLTLAWPFPETAEISWLAVHPNHRRGGRGRMLVEQAAARALQNGARTLYLFTSTSTDPRGVKGYEGTRQFYAAVGFVRLWAGRQIGWSEDSLLMARWPEVHGPTIF